ncbi:hypothetical protein [Streptomyces sp. 142MFCol3.1]|uniref:hypothetical protein n=1 Tax=Streptomyces sp. 142MFCol3.1 TaxID=1172179 RepID=UPI0003FFB737|nr:hypothetical protein [Streptomyces sp. 142MFCol3.1]
MGTDEHVCPSCGQPVDTVVRRHKTLGAWVPVWGPGPCHNPECEAGFAEPRRHPVREPDDAPGRTADDAPGRTADDAPGCAPDDASGERADRAAVDRPEQGPGDRPEEPARPNAQGADISRVRATDGGP